VDFQAVAVRVVEVQREADAVVDRRNPDAALPEAIVGVRQRRLVVGLDRGVVQADAGARPGGVLADRLERDVVVSLASGEEGVPTDALADVEAEHVGVEVDRPIEVPTRRWTWPMECTSRPDRPRPKASRRGTRRWPGSRPRYH